MILTFDKLMEFTNANRWFGPNEMMKTYQGYVSMCEENHKHVKQTGGYPNCHCNICIDAIEEYHGLMKYDEFWYKGYKVYIASFCPFEECADVFVRDKEVAFCAWLSIDETKYWKERNIDTVGVKE